MPMNQPLGDEILAALRSMRGGIYYTKSNSFVQTHYVDQYPIYTCALVPDQLVPIDQRKFLTTEVSIGLVRREALELLGYSYEEMKTGTFAISGDLEQVCWIFSFRDLRPSLIFIRKQEDIEEMVKLSFQALDKSSARRSKVIIKENGWDEMIRDMNHRYSHPVPYSHPVSYSHPMPDSPEPRFRDYFGPQLHGEHENVMHMPDRGNTQHSFETPGRPRTNSFVRSRGTINPRTPPNEVERQNNAAPETQRPEVRFTLPRAQLNPSDIHKDQAAQLNRAKPRIPTSSTDGDLRTARLKLEQYKLKQEVAEKAMDIATASDLRYYAIPDLEARIQRLVELQREEQNKRSIPESEKIEEKLETESEGLSENLSGIQDLYD